MSKRVILLTMFIAAIISGSAFLFSFLADRFTPVDALIKAQTVIEREGLSNALQPLLKIARTDRDLAPWVDILEARVLVKQGKIPEAVRILYEMPESHASSMDARLEILKMHLAGNDQIPSELRVKDTLEFDRKLERDALNVGRTDIISNLIFLRATSAEKQGDIQIAATLLRSLVERRTGKDIVEEALNRLAELAIKYPQLAPTNSVTDCVTNAKTLVEAGNLKEALKVVNKSKETLSDGSTGYAELAFLEGLLLSRLKLTTEATPILDKIARLNDPFSSPRALLELTRIAWNQDRNSDVIGYSTQLSKQFPESFEHTLASFMEGRSMEEENRLTESLVAYDRALQSRGVIPALKINSLKRKAWVLVRRKELNLALAAFDDMAKETASFAERNSGNQLPPSLGFFPSEYERMTEAQAKDDERHARYWAAYFRLKLPGASDQVKAAAEDELRSLVEDYPFSYYAFRAREVLGIKELLPRFTESPSRKEKEEKDSFSFDSCTTVISADTSSHLLRLTNAGLRNLAEHELEWLFYRKQAPWSLRNLGNMPGDPNVALPVLISGLGKSKAFYDIEMYKTGIYSALQVENALQKSPPLKLLYKKCGRELLGLLFPTAYLSIYQKAVKKNASITMPLLLALSRRESLFDPEAKSDAGALGIMQLMPATAQGMGIQTGQLTIPEINIDTGSKYLAKMLQEFSANKTQAIAAYNAGPTPVRKWISAFPGLTEKEWIEMISYTETRQYVKAVLTGEHLYLLK